MSEESKIDVGSVIHGSITVDKQGVARNQMGDIVSFKERKFDIESAIEKIEALMPLTDAPELSERAYRQASLDCIKILKEEQENHDNSK